jgi:hypothetical protein
MSVGPKNVGLTSEENIPTRNCQKGRATRPLKFLT